MAAKKKIDYASENSRMLGELQQKFKRSKVRVSKKPDDDVVHAAAERGEKLRVITAFGLKRGPDYYPHGSQVEMNPNDGDCRREFVTTEETYQAGHYKRVVKKAFEATQRYQVLITEAKKRVTAGQAQRIATLAELKEIDDEIKTAESILENRQRDLYEQLQPIAIV